MIGKIFASYLLLFFRVNFCFSGGPPAERTGNPGEICGNDTCASSCHTSFSVNAGSAQFSNKLAFF